jgi:hypothetical protein
VEAEAATANKELQQAEMTLSHAKSELKSKRDEMKSKRLGILRGHLVFIVRRIGEEAQGRD